jgi:5-(carboxyamino)imidazole ribonucleotide synthase
MTGIIGILGGGQLGRMLSIAAFKLGYKVHVFSPESDCPARWVTPFFTHASYTDTEALDAFAQHVDVVTSEFEHIPIDSLRRLAMHVPVYPEAETMAIAQHRIREKTYAQQHGIPVPAFRAVDSIATYHAARAALGTDTILKTATFGYDGKGQWHGDHSGIHAVLEEGTLCILEARVPLVTEISVIAARNQDGCMVHLPVTENAHAHGILVRSCAPASVSHTIAARAIAYTETLMASLNMVGLLAVEYFVCADGSVLFNEMAPRPHNSGHWTIEGCVLNQFDYCIRAITGLPLPIPYQHGPMVMDNVLGQDVCDAIKNTHAPGISVHHYGKTDIRSGRKVGHITRVTA